MDQSINYGSKINLREEIESLFQEFNGEYIFESVLGVGGMGNVYKVLNPNGQVFALKHIKNDLLNDTETRKRFEAEFTVLSILNHKNIIKLQSSGWLENGSLYLVMECLNEGSLSELLKKQVKLDFKSALVLIHQICQALECAHSHNIIHRDLKP